MNPVDIAWAAGIFEGEGTIYQGFNSANNSLPVLAVKMTDRDVIERLCKILPFGTFYEIQNWPEGNKQPFQWRATGWPSFEKFEELIGPYLGERRSAKLASVKASRREILYSPSCSSPSYAGYKRHLRRGEPACPECRSAMREASSRWRRTSQDNR